MVDQINEEVVSAPSPEAIREVMQQEKSLRLVHYKIENGAITPLNRPDEGRFVKYTHHLDHLAQKYPLPDCEFIITLHDGAPDCIAIPFLCFSKKADQKGIMVPDPDSLDGEKLLKIQAKAGSRLYPWHKKINQAFWRGAPSGLEMTVENYTQAPRFQLVECSRQHPDLVDAKFSRILPELDALLSPYKGKLKNIPGHLKYKYQILVDGNSCAWSRAYWQLYSNSVIIKHDSPYVQWYYKGLQPWVHYIPAAHDFNNLIEQIEWAQSHDQEAYQISENAQRFAREHLEYDDMLEYLYLVISTISQRSHQASPACPSRCISLESCSALEANNG